MAVKKTASALDLPALKIETMRVRIVGDSRLVCHAWDEKAKQEMRDKQMKRAKQAKEAKDPEACFKASLYWIDKDTCGFPAIGLKKAAVDACSHVDGVTKVEARGAFHIPGDLIPINGTPQMREDMVRIAMGTADLRYRGEFPEWSMEFDVCYNANVLSAGQIVNLFNTAGFAIGIGENRPQRDGAWGMWHVE